MNDAVPFTDSRFAGLHRMVLDAPADDGPRLVLADYYEEILGDADRAEFIRAQIELAARHPQGIKAERQLMFGETQKEFFRYGKSSAWGRQQKQLEARESALLAQHGATWAEPLAKLFWPDNYKTNPGWACHDKDGASGVSGVRWRFSRGFVSHLSCSLAALWRPCARCGGDGERKYIDADGLEYSNGKCLHCHGSSSLGIGDAVWACVPVTEVELVGSEPMDATDGQAPLMQAPWTWWDSRDGHLPEHSLPVEIFDLLAGDSDSMLFYTNGRSIPQGDRAKSYKTAALADSALSAAVVRHFRRRAGLAELEGQA